jgi:lipoprotein-anchoring transpeptidase ErfK/SrfK
MRTLGRLGFGLALCAAALAACSEPKTDPEPGATPKEAPTTANAPTLTSDARDAGAVARAAKDAGPKAPPPYTGPYIGALFRETPVMSDMGWPKSDDKRKGGERSGAVRIGYIRQGSKVPVIPEPHVKPNCKEGWYELVQGGFVCGKYASLDMSHPRLKVAPHPADMTGMLPYEYGYNVRNGTPLYRTIPSREERLEIEPWLAPKKKKAPPRPAPSDEDTTVSIDEALDAGAASSSAPPALQLARQTTPADPFALGDALDSGVPWYLRDYDGGKPQVTLEDLRGEGPVARRMVKGFFLALDKSFTANGARWWKNTSGLIAPYERVFVYKNASDFHGVWLNQPDPRDASAGADAGHAPIEGLCTPGSKAQIGILTRYHSKKYVVSLNKKAVTKGDSVSRHTVVRLTGETAIVGGAEYDETDEGWWMKAAEGVKTNPGPPPADLAPGEKWIDVNLRTQTLVAFEGDRPVFATAVSTGKENKVDKEKDHKTPTGSFRIREKHVAATMDGDVASDGPYSIEDVPWIMYFNGSYALHGAFWHNSFGMTKSHGCVNLAPTDAKALFNWTEPRLPEGWHGVMATSDRPGTRVIVHE